MRPTFPSGHSHQQHSRLHYEEPAWKTGFRQYSHFELLLLGNEAIIDEVLVAKLFDADDYEQSKMEAFLLSRGSIYLKLFMRCVVTFWSSNSKHQQRVRQRILKLLSSPKMAASFDSPAAQKDLLKLVVLSIHAGAFRQECCSALELMVSNDAFLFVLNKGNFLQVLSSKLIVTDSIMSLLLFCCGVRPQKLPVFLDGKEKVESNSRTGEAKSKEDPSPEFVRRLATLAQKHQIIEALLAELESNRTTRNVERIGQFLLTALSGDTSSPIVPHILNLLQNHKKAWSSVVAFTLGCVKSNPKSEEHCTIAEIWTRILSLYVAQRRDSDFELEEIFNNIERYPNVVLLRLLDLAALLCTMKGVCNKLKTERILVNTFKLLSIPRNEAVSAKLVTIFTAVAGRPKIDLLEHVLHDCQLLYYFAESCKKYRAKNSIAHKDYNPIFVEIGIRFIFLARRSGKFEKTCEAANDWKFIPGSDLFKHILRAVQQIDRASKETKTFDQTSTCPRNYVIKVFEYEDGNDSTPPQSPKIIDAIPPLPKPAATNDLLFGSESEVEVEAITVANTTKEENIEHSTLIAEARMMLKHLQQEKASMLEYKIKRLEDLPRSAPEDKKKRKALELESMLFYLAGSTKTSASTSTPAPALSPAPLPQAEESYVPPRVVEFITSSPLSVQHEASSSNAAGAPVVPAQTQSADDGEGSSDEDYYDDKDYGEDEDEDDGFNPVIEDLC